MNLICFPHYTCGGLLTDILQQTFSPVGSNGGINSLNHTIGKIGDASDVFSKFDAEELYKRIEQFVDNGLIDKDDWVATHCHPDLIDTAKFNRVIAVTTATNRSRLYRWIRVYNHYFAKSDPWLSEHGQSRVDKERETAKNYTKSFEPGQGSNVINIEFADIVETNPEFKRLVAGLDFETHMVRWREVNKFLYEDSLWNSVPVKRFYEAELELALGRYYIYE